MLADELKEIRQAAKLSIKQMADYLGVQGRTVRRYEDGTRLPGGPVTKLYMALAVYGGEEK